MRTSGDAGNAAGRASPRKRDVGGGYDMRKALSKIELPVLIISSSSDRTVPASLTNELEKGLKNV
jgi:pimeloyl-ACP methyl ester carboxylesterase